jgi:thiamine-phosphate pyrophosphorylase
MQMTFRWYGEGNDRIKLSDIKQIPGVSGIVWALHDKMPGEVWEEWEIAKVKEECDKYKAKLIINDNSDLALKIGANGVHLGQKDEAISIAKGKIRENQIIGKTCNSLEHIKQAVKSCADYIGLGPYRFTSTKENLSPILGIEGYKYLNLDIPIYAIGGIRLEDAKPLSETRIYGIAISSLILESKEPEKKVKELRKYFKEII